MKPTAFQNATRALLHENRLTLRLAAPMIAGQVGQILIGWADTIMVAHLGVLALAACAFAVMMVNVFLVFGFGLTSSVSIRVSHAVGAKRPREAGELLIAGTVKGALAGLLMVGLMYAALPWLSHLGQDPRVLAEGRGLMILLGWSVLPVLLTIVGKNFSESLGRPWLPFWIMMGGVVLNIGLNWLFIGGRWGMPALGVAGAGMGTLLARTAVAVALFAALLAGKGYRPYLVWKISRETLFLRLGSLLRVGLPSGAHLLGEVGLFAAATLMMGWVGETALAAHQVAITCASTAFMFPLGFAFAVTVRVGHAVGAGELHRVRPITFGALAMGSVVMGAFALFFLTAGGWVARCFVEDPEVVRLTATLLAISACFSIFDGGQAVAMGALRGLADVRVPMLFIYIAYWAIALPAGYGLAFHAGWGGAGIWTGLLIGLFCAALAIVTRFCIQSRKPVAAAVSREAVELF